MLLVSVQHITEQHKRLILIMILSIHMTPPFVNTLWLTIRQAQQIEMLHIKFTSQSNLLLSNWNYRSGILETFPAFICKKAWTIERIVNNGTARKDLKPPQSNMVSPQPLFSRDPYLRAEQKDLDLTNEKVGPDDLTRPKNYVFNWHWNMFIWSLE